MWFENSAAQNLGIWIHRNFWHIDSGPPKISLYHRTGDLWCGILKPRDEWGLEFEMEILHHLGLKCWFYIFPSLWCGFQKPHDQFRVGKSNRATPRILENQTSLRGFGKTKPRHSGDLGKPNHVTRGIWENQTTSLGDLGKPNHVTGGLVKTQRRQSRGLWKPNHVTPEIFENQTVSFQEFSNTQSLS